MFFSTSRTESTAVGSLGRGWGPPYCQLAVADRAYIRGGGDTPMVRIRGPADVRRHGPPWGELTREDGCPGRREKTLPIRGGGEGGGKGVVVSVGYLGVVQLE
jgi:hypothetical protein